MHGAVVWSVDSISIGIAVVGLDMSGGGSIANDGEEAAGGGGGGRGEVTFTVVMSCLTAGAGGLLLGYDIGVTGGVTQMESFLQAFFPEVLRKMSSAKQDAYCIFDSQVLNAFVSSFYLSTMVASLVAGHLTKTLGRRNSLLIAGVLFFAGTLLNLAAVNISMLIIGRILLGVAVGFSSLAAPVYLAEIAPARWRGAFTASIGLFGNLGFLMADMINYRATTMARWGWRLSLGAGIVPAVIVIVGAAFIPDTPNSLALRGRLDEARDSLRRIRGAADVDAELKDIVRAAEEDRRYKSGALRRLLRREYRPHLVMAVLIMVFFEMTGAIVVAIFTPLLFYTVGFTSQKAILGSIITDVVSIVSVAAAAAVVDRHGRRRLFMVGGAVLILCQIFPLEVRSAALGLGGTISSALTFMQSQSFLEMLCSFKYGAFAYYAGWLVMMTAFVAAFLPETKGVPIESMGALGMAGGGSIANDGEAAAGGNGGGDEVTFTVVMSCLTAGAVGLLLGYDIGVTGGLTQMESFLQAFFPEVLRKMSSAKQDAYCIFDSQVLNAFVSSFYLSTMVASLVAGHLTKTLGRRNSLLIAGVLFFAGTLLNLAAVNISMLIIGRILLGVAVGFSSLAAPVYLAEISPARWRGAFTSSIGLFANFGFLMADMINYRATTMARWGWRLSLGAGIVPALIVIVGAASIPDTPNSLALRGRLDEARDSLRRIRGAGVAMAWIFGAELGTDGGRAMPRGYAVAMVAVVCMYAAGLCVSWVPLSSVVTSEIFPLEVRSAALGLGGAISSALTFMQSQSFLEMLCSFKYGAFAYYAGWLVMMTAFVAAFLPETKGRRWPSNLHHDGHAFVSTLSFDLSVDAKPTINPRSPHPPPDDRLIPLNYYL
uniref:Major facilitator superfamily (MFS) profile domain-containing protein n=1 Tax=Oryza rufipogon TaxID=4529 RepID=A0A0E0NGR6_ORYRU